MDTMEYSATVFIMLIGLSIGMVPWIGILKVRVANKDSGTGVVFIKENIAIAVSNEVTQLNNDLRLAARIYYYNGGKLSTCYVIEIITHPEYYNNIVNTITLIFVKCLLNYYVDQFSDLLNTHTKFGTITLLQGNFIHKIKKITGTYILWPHENIVYDKDLFAIGVKDNKYGFNEFSFNVEQVNKNICKQFYVNEELDYDSLWPSNFICVKSEIDNRCAFEAGMPLVHKNGPIWTLVGISTLGPGCSLPSRFILLSPYIPWIERSLYTFTSRRKHNLKGNETAPPPENPFLSETLDKEDDFVISKLSDSTMVMRTNLSSTIDRYGECTNIDGEIMYKEQGRVEASGHTATGTYALSLYDALYNKITCVLIRVRCNKRTTSKLWYDTGFHQEDLSQLIQTVPLFKRNQTVPPKIVYNIDSYAKYEKYRTVNVIFKFEFTNMAKIFIDFYARKATTTMIPIPDYLD